MKKIKQYILGLSWIWLPIIGSYMAEMLFQIIWNLIK